MHPQIAELVRQLDSATVHARAIATPASDAAFHQRPPSGGWSAAECVAHLSLTTQALLPLIDAALASGRPGFPDGRRYRSDTMGWLLAWSLEPPARVRIRTLPSFVPSSTGSKGAILAEFERLQGELAGRLERASGLDLHPIRVRSPFNSKVSYNAFAAFRVLLAHERRHLGQAERALAAAHDSSNAPTPRTGRKG
ncbi:MAG TPA: DinB family protein [Gemmatimonadaceae bacterium]|nr:DinB family protein [Gemmatimonadaceae bacterium]